MVEEVPAGIRMYLVLDIHKYIYKYISFQILYYVMLPYVYVVHTNVMRQKMYVLQLCV